MPGTFSSPEAMSRRIASSPELDCEKFTKTVFTCSITVSSVPSRAVEGAIGQRRAARLAQDGAVTVA